MKKRVRIFAVWIAALAALPGFAYAEPQAEAAAEVFFMGSRVETDVAPYYDADAGGLRVPLRFVLEAAGYSVMYEEETATVTAVSPENARYIVLQIGNTNVFGNTDGFQTEEREPRRLSHAPVEIDGRTMVTAEFFDLLNWACTSSGGGVYFTPNAVPAD
ncbi:MAG: copper amine oxidase N-terminal domain-containing protein [Clostridiales bacterium]|jgi:hypothetical protein|nr:copper amine oxidase N-terminal domain-containing protein [Clostridiales bacterium]